MRPKDKHNKPKPIKLFLSYAHEDEEYKDELVKHLSGLVRKGDIEQWNDRQIIAGQSWDGEIKEALAEAQIILFLVSADFMNSEYIFGEEMVQAVERHNKGELTMVPVIVRPCDFGSLELTNYQALPTGAQAIVTWEHRDMAWVDVVRGLKRVIESIQSESE